MPLLPRPLTCPSPRNARSLLALLGFAWATLFTAPLPSLAQDPVTPAPAPEIDLDQFCRFPELARAQKESLRSAMIDRNENQAEYLEILGEHALLLHQCREQEWPQKQALWLRLYPCDLKPGRLEQIFDRIVNQGYNQVYVEVFYDGRVLLPKAQNSTAWPSVLNEPGQENIDLFALAIDAGRQRGLEVYGWMFTMNFGYSYASRPDRQDAIARNAQGQSSLDLVSGEVQVFIDPYNSQAQWDYRLLVESMLQRRPDGLLFDYIRYPRGDGAASVVSRVQDLLIHTPAARQSLLNRALNDQGRDLISRFLQKGHVGVWDVTDVGKRYPLEPEPLWEGRQPRFQEGKSLTAALEQPWLQQDLWLLSVAHAQRGILDFLGLATQPVQAAGLPAGAVFFPGANRTVGQQGFDSRLQPWNQFPSTLEWHPMAYSLCQGTDCIVAEVERVLALASPDTWVQPALAGTWGDSLRDRPSLEEQMLALKAATPQLPAVSHFAYSWQYPQDDQSRKFCTR
ncbi:MAG: hypothetical protein VKK80_05835 [Prochlorothrix sp.]|nr:hypothetical protein [Prochlorothrix sp.]